MKNRTTNKKSARPVSRKSVKDLGAPEAQSVKGGPGGASAERGGVSEHRSSVKP